MAMRRRLLAAVVMMVVAGFLTGPGRGLAQDTVEVGNAVQKVVFTKSATVPGRYGAAAGFNVDAGRMVTIPGIADFNAAERTAEFWCRTPVSGAYQVLVARGPKTAGHWEAYLNPQGNACYYVKTDAGDFVGESTRFLADNAWHFISLRMRSGEVSLAVDGTAAASGTLSGSLPATSEPVTVGSLAAAEAPYRFPVSGAIDDLRLSSVWRSSLAAPEEPMTADGATCGLYAFNAASGGQFPDASSSGNAALVPAGSETYHLVTYVRDGASWAPLFDAQRSLVDGLSFGLEPKSFTTLEDTAERKAVRFTGAGPGYGWDLDVEARPTTPLVKFRLTCHPSAAITLTQPQPDVAFWMDGTPEVLVEQGPMSIYGGTDYGASFPAAYLWRAGKEAAVFFNMTPMTWMGWGNAARFYSLRVKALAAGGQTGLGMDTFALYGNTIGAGDVVFEYYLFAQARPEQPSKLDGLDRLVEVFAELHPADATIPPTRIAPNESSWEVYAREGIEELMLEGVLYHDETSTWNDAPLGLVSPVTQVRVHGGSPNTMGWDFSTVNNHLSPWILYTRLNPDAQMADFARRKKDGLPLFYDPQANLIRWGTRQPPHLGDLEMSWQNFFFHIETSRTGQVLAQDDFNPAILGRLLMAASGLIEYAHNVDYVFAQWFDPYAKQPVVQNDVPELGDVREPWQAGSYAYIMLQAYGLTGRGLYLEEARTAIETLLTTMTYTEENARYTVTYTNAADFPITELFGNAYGAVAAYRIYEITGDAAYKRYARDFLDSLLRLTFWYEDNLGPIAQALGNAGLFHPHGGAFNTTPWENADAHISLTWLLKHYVDLPVTPLLLKLTNLNRINSFHYYPATWTPEVRALGVDDSVNPYHPIEPFYSFEAGGHVGVPAAYMAGLGMWNYWMYEALAEADDPRIMVLNLDVLEGYEDALQSVERHFIVYNPTTEARTFFMLAKHLATGDYTVLVTDSAGAATERPASSADLGTGLDLTLSPLDYARVTVRKNDAAALQAGIVAWKSAQASLSYTYQVLQELARDGGVTPELQAYADRFTEAMATYNQGDYPLADVLAESLRNDALGVSPQCPECIPDRFPLFLAGDEACLQIPGPVPPDSPFRWSKDGAGVLYDNGHFKGTRCRALQINNLTPADSGTYECVYADAKALYRVTITVTADEGLPGPGAMAVAGAGAGLAVWGALMLSGRGLGRRGKQRYLQ